MVGAPSIDGKKHFLPKAGNQARPLPLSSPRNKRSVQLRQRERDKQDSSSRTTVKNQTCGKERRGRGTTKRWRPLRSTRASNAGAKIRSEGVRKISEREREIRGEEGKLSCVLGFGSVGCLFRPCKFCLFP